MAKMFATLFVMLFGSVSALAQAPEKLVFFKDNRGGFVAVSCAYVAAAYQSTDGYNFHPLEIRGGSCKIGPGDYCKRNMGLADPLNSHRGLWNISLKNSELSTTEKGKHYRKVELEADLLVFKPFPKDREPLALLQIEGSEEFIYASAEKYNRTGSVRLFVGRSDEMKPVRINSVSHQVDAEYWLDTDRGRLKSHWGGKESWAGKTTKGLDPKKHAIQESDEMVVIRAK
jgi:hypothetical protein